MPVTNNQSELRESGLEFALDQVSNLLLDTSPEQLPDNLLLALLLRGVLDDTTIPEADSLLREFKSIGAVLTQASENPGVDEKISNRLRVLNAVLRRVLLERVEQQPVIDSAWRLKNYLKFLMGYEQVEHFRILFLNKKNILIKDEVQSRGTVDHTPLYPREIAKRALELGASAIIMVHNHPSGDPTPSREDITMTTEVIATLKPLGIVVHDHIIVSRDSYTSFLSRNLL